MNNSSRMIGLMTAVALLALSITGCGSSGDGGDSSAISTAVAVNVQQVQKGSMESFIKVSTQVSANSTVDVTPKVGGIVESLQVQVGDMVRAGDLLFVVDDTDLQLSAQTAMASIQQAQASVNSAQAQYNSAVGGSSQSQLDSARTAMDSAKISYDDAVKNLERTKELYEVGGAAQTEVESLESSVELARQQYEAAKTQYELLNNQILKESAEAAAAGVKQAQAGVESARTQYQSIQNQIANTRVKAEVSGMVASNNVTVGGMVNANSPAMTLMDIDTVKVVLGVSDEVINQISMGSPVYVTISAASDQPFEGHVTNIAPAPDNSTMLYPVEVELQNPDHIIKPGMFASAKLVLSSQEGVISLPLNAVVSKNDETYVFVVQEDNTVKKVNVETGMSNEESIEIVSGLQEGDQVVIKGQDYLIDGSSVEVV